MSSGVQVDESCISTYQALQTSKQLRHIVFKLSDDNKSIIVDTTKPVDKDADPTAEYEEFVKSVPQDECRWFVYDFEYTHTDESTGHQGQRNKVLFISWAPDGAKIKPKMIYASSREGLRRKLTGIQAEIQGTDLSEIDHEAVLNKINRK
ncbi:cofilin [Mortierella sp. NVP85]|nr:cofilin [Mortierella sp. NVP85]